jgi:hypothetical protein
MSDYAVAPIHTIGVALRYVGNSHPTRLPRLCWHMGRGRACHTGTCRPSQTPLSAARSPRCVSIFRSSRRQVEWPLRLRALVGLRRDLNVSHGIVFDAIGGHWIGPGGHSLSDSGAKADHMKFGVCRSERICACSGVKPACCSRLMRLSCIVFSNSRNA